MDNLVKRDIFDQVVAHLDQGEITVIIGPRQVGKTTLLLQLKDYLVTTKKLPAHRIKIFNLDLQTDRGVFRDQATFVEYLKAEAGKEKLFVFVDEAQRLPNPGLFFKGIFDLYLPIKLVLTGSSALEIRSHIHEALTGRKRIFLLEPFSFEEYIRATNPEYDKWLHTEMLSSVHREGLIHIYKQYLVYGGYPKVVQADNTEKKRLVLTELYQSYLDKDIIGFLKVGDPDTFTRCISALAFQIGNLVNIQELSSMLGIARATVERYLNILEQTFITFRVTPYYTNPRTELKKMSKYYFKDTGLRNFIAKSLDIWEVRMDQGPLLENAVAHGLSRSIHPPDALHFWRSKSKAEVDFVIPSRPPIPLEVKLKVKNRSLGSRSFIAFMEEYKTLQGYLVSFSEQSIVQKNHHTIQSVLPWRLNSIF